jgi:hypothetical protein
MPVISALSWLGFGLLLVAGVTRVMAILRLRQAHRSKWEALGRPSLIPLPIGPGNAATRRLLWEEGVVEELNDRRLNLYIRLTRALGTVVLVDFAILVLLFLVHRL